MSTGPGNIPERDAPSIGEVWRAGCECNRAGLCYRCLAAKEIERLKGHAIELHTLGQAAANRADDAERECESWRAVAHDHSERLKLLTTEGQQLAHERDCLVERVAGMRAMLVKLAGECAECGGTGTRHVSYGGDGYGGRCAAQADAEAPCEECADIRQAIGEVS